MAVPAAVAALTAALLLVASGVSHLRRPTALRSDLTAHAVLPPRAVAPIAVGLPVAELTTGLALVVSLAAGRTPLTAALAAQTGIFAAFAGYLAAVVRSGRQGLPCGCGLPEVPVGPAAVTRAAGLALLSVAALVCVRTRWWAGPPTDLADVALLVVAAPTLALLLAVVQPARRLHQPPSSERVLRGAVR